jgi:prepilin-type N-terminal cleavage/methylation domain-containing protein
MSSYKKAFTLIELIIGITILSLLAVALLAALDPIEQINKARDTSTRNIAQELHNAVNRFNAAKDEFPPAILTMSAGSNITPNPTPAAADGLIKELIDIGELKSNFKQAAGKANLEKLNIFKVDDGAGGISIYTCFQPQSKQEKTKSGMFNLGTGSTPDWSGTSTPTAGTCSTSTTSVTGRGMCVSCFQ